VDTFCQTANVRFVRQVGQLKDVIVVEEAMEKVERGSERHVSRARQMEQLHGVAFASPLVKRRRFTRSKVKGTRKSKSKRNVAPPTDPLYSEQWHLPMIKAPEAW
jgi:hypothetical protein